MKTTSQVETREITLRVPKPKYRFMKELIRNLEFVEVEEDRELSKEEILQGIERGLREAALMKAGKLPKKNIEDLLREF